MTSFSKSPSASFPFSVFDLSYTKRFDADMGLLIPIYEQEVYPGERYKVGVAYNIKSMPMVAPLMASIDVYFHYFFVPYRTIHNRATMSKWGDNNTFEEYITGQDSTHTLPMLSDLSIKQYDDKPWMVSNMASQGGAVDGLHCLSSYFGFPPLLQHVYNIATFDQFYPVDVSSPVAEVIPQYLWRAYAKIYSDYYADENLSVAMMERFNPFSLSETQDYLYLPNRLLRRAWRKDYFTSALPFQQKGTPVALPVDVSFSVAQGLDYDLLTTQVGELYSASGLGGSWSSSSLSGYGTVGVSSSSTVAGDLVWRSGINRTRLNELMQQGLSATSFNISDFRLVNAIQAWMERNAVSGTRYVEYLRGQYGFAPRDDEVDRAVYLGGYRAPVLIQQVQQTSSTFSDSTAQGTLTGQGYSVDASSIFNRRFYEHGVIMGIMSIMPKAQYADGVDRNWIKRDIYDWHVPVFNNLSEEEVLPVEVSVANSDPLGIFGYQQRKGYLRWRKDIACGELSPSGSLHYWTLTRDLRAGASLNERFILCSPSKDWLAYPEGSAFVCEVSNLVKAARQLPYVPEPSLRTY